MASFLCKISILFAFFCLTLLFPEDQHIVKGDNDLCGAPSALFHGSCSSDKACNNLCKGTEGAMKGFCQDQMCFCMNKCQKQKHAATTASKLDDICDKPSGRFHGLCFDTNACHNLCLNGEGALGGLCLDFKCQCLVAC